MRIDAVVIFDSYVQLCVCSDDAVRGCRVAATDTVIDLGDERNLH